MPSDDSARACGQEAVATQGGLTDASCYVLCDARVKGFPVRLASSGFKALFQYPDGDMPIHTERLAGCSCLADSEAAAAEAGRAAGLPAEEAATALRLLEDLAAEECRRVADSRGGGESGAALLVKARRGGEMFACELALSLLRHPTTGWSFLVGLHRDAGTEVSVRDALRAAAAGPTSAQELLAGLRLRGESQDGLLKHPDSASHLQEAFDKVCRGLLTGSIFKGGSFGSSEDDGGKQSTKLRRKKSCSEFSAATTASHVSVLRKSKTIDAGVLASVCSSSSAGTQEASATEKAGEPKRSTKAVAAAGAGRLMDLLESVGTASDGDPARQASSAYDEQLSPEGEYNPVCKQELCSFQAPFALFDPSKPGLPAVVSSASLSDAVRRTSGEGSPGDLALGHLADGLCGAAECRDLCAAAAQGAYFRGGCSPSLAVKRMQPLAEGELLCADRGDGPCERLAYLKQMELDDRMYVACLWAPVPGAEEAQQLLQCTPAGGLVGEQQLDLEERRCLALANLDNQMDELVQVLASHFWYCAPMRRQSAVGEDGGT